MLTASQSSGGNVRNPLSPMAQATLEKHLPGLPSRRLLHQVKAQKCDVGCITGELD